MKMHVRVKINEVHLELVSLLSLENSSVDTCHYARVLTRLGAVQHLVQTSLQGVNYYDVIIVAVF